MPTVSVIVPIYNTERYLDECLASLAAQTLGDLEVVCVNDGSTDGSRQIIEGYLARDGRFRVIDKANSGYGDSVNRGIEAASGDWVTILEPDDFIEPDAYEAMVAAGERHGAPIVKADFWLYWTRGGYDKRYGWTRPSLSGLVWPECEREVFFQKPSIWSAIYRRDLLLQGDVRCLATPGASYQDAGFQFRSFARAERVWLMNRAFVHYRQDNEASSVRSPAKALCVCDEFDGMVAWLSRHPELPRWLAPTICRMRYDTYLWNYDRLSDELRPAFLERMAADFKAEDEADLPDPLLFDPGAWRYRAFVEEDPELFASMHELIIHEPASKAETARSYLERGGVPLLARALGRAIGDKLTR